VEEQICGKFVFNQFSNEFEHSAEQRTDQNDGQIKLFSLVEFIFDKFDD
jgi:hypothetical protein